MTSFKSCTLPTESLTIVRIKNFMSQKHNHDLRGFFVDCLTGKTYCKKKRSYMMAVAIYRKPHLFLSTLSIILLFCQILRSYYYLDVKVGKNRTSKDKYFKVKVASKASNGFDKIQIKSVQEIRSSKNILVSEPTESKVLEEKIDFKYLKPQH